MQRKISFEFEGRKKNNEVMFNYSLLKNCLLESILTVLRYGRNPLIRVLWLPGFLAVNVAIYLLMGILVGVGFGLQG